MPRLCVDGWPIGRRARILLVGLGLAAVLAGILTSPSSFAQAPAPDAAAAPSASPAAEQSYLAWFVGAMGWHYTLAFLGISFALLALLIMNVLALRRDNIAPTSLAEAFEQRLSGRQFQEAFELARADDSLLGQVLAAGLAKASVGYDQVVEAMQEAGDSENMRLEHLLSYLALIGTISPMIGLLGTVEGMVEAFMVIANTNSGAPNPQDLADGISKALLTTLVGLYLAIPAIAAYNLLRNRMSKLILEAGTVSGQLMSRFKNGEKKTVK